MGPQLVERLARGKRLVHQNAAPRRPAPRVDGPPPEADLEAELRVVEAQIEQAVLPPQRGVLRAVRVADRRVAPRRRAHGLRQRRRLRDRLAQRRVRDCSCSRLLLLVRCGPGVEPDGRRHAAERGCLVGRHFEADDALFGVLVWGGWRRAAAGRGACPVRAGQRPSCGLSSACPSAAPAACSLFYVPLSHANVRERRTECSGGVFRRPFARRAADHFYRLRRAFGVGYGKIA